MLPDAFVTYVPDRTMCLIMPDFDFERHSRHERRYNLIHPVATRADGVRHRRALQHLKEGFYRRVLMIDASARSMYERVDAEGTAPLSALDVPELAIQVNAFWLNLCGALDNLAWALQYELAVLAGVDESSVGRLDVGLFRPKFLRALEKDAPGLAEDLREHEAWYAELRELRDPAAHRIPIYPLPAVLNEEQGAETKKLYDEADVKFKGGQLDEGMELLHRGYNTGKYQPWISLSHEGSNQFFHLRPLLKRDEDGFASVAELVLHQFFPGFLARRAV